LFAFFFRVRVPYPFQWGAPKFRASHVFGMIGAALVSSAEVCSPFQKYLFCLPLILEALCEVLINLQGLWCELPNFNPLWLWIWFLTSLFLWWKWEISCLSIYVPNQSIYFDVVNWNVFCCCTACRCYEPPSSCS
jgi:hypothetical protein